MATTKPSLQIQREEHNEDVLAKRVDVVSSATIYAVTNTTISLATADLEIGAVEIKDGSSDTRATVDGDGLYVSLRKTLKGSLASYGSATATATPVEILATDTDRLAAFVTNNSSATVFVGFDNSVSSTNGTPLKRDDSVEITDYTGTVFAVADATGADVRFLIELI